VSRKLTMKNKFAPIIVTAFNRPLHLSSMLGSLLSNIECNQSDIYFFVDGPRNYDDIKKIHSVIFTAKRFSKEFKTFKIFTNKENLGVRRQVLNAGNFIFKNYHSAIFIEDDLILSSSFLNYMNRALNRFENKSEIGCISGHSVFGNLKIREPALCKLSNYGHNLGWATWQREWNIDEFNPEKQLKILYALGKQWNFDRKGFYPFTKKLMAEFNNPGRSWAISWLAYCFIKEKITIFPSDNLVLHTGTDSTATNYRYQTHDPLLSHLHFITSEQIDYMLNLNQLIDCEKEFQLFLKKSAEINIFSRIKAFSSYFIQNLISIKIF